MIGLPKERTLDPLENLHFALPGPSTLYVAWKIPAVVPCLQYPVQSSLAFHMVQKLVSSHTLSRAFFLVQLEQANDTNTQRVSISWTRLFVKVSVPVVVDCAPRSSQEHCSAAKKREVEGIRQLARRCGQCNRPETRPRQQPSSYRRI